MDIFKRSKGSWLIILPLVVAEGSKVGIVWVVQEDVHILLQTCKLRLHSSFDLVFLGLSSQRTSGGRVTESRRPFIVLRQVSTARRVSIALLTGTPWRVAKSPATGFNGWNVVW